MEAHFAMIGAWSDVTSKSHCSDSSRMVPTRTPARVTRGVSVTVKLGDLRAAYRPVEVSGGPLPHPDLNAAFEEAHAGSADRIMKMAEAERRARKMVFAIALALSAPLGATAGVIRAHKGKALAAGAPITGAALLAFAFRKLLR